MLKQHTQRVLQEFAESVIAKAKQNLQSQGKNVSNELMNSFKQDIKVSDNSIQLGISMAEHGFYQDEGVKGVKSGAKAPSSRFKFGAGNSGKGKIMDGVFRWVKSKRIQFKDRKAIGGKGRFLSYERTARLVARHVYDYGLKPSRFMTEALETEYKTLPDELITAYGLDIDDFLKYAFNENKSK